MTIEQFPSDFLWGASTAGHQIEGDNVTSDTWFLENVSPTVFREPSGKACNSWELWEQDLDLVANMELNAYRFSVEWARVEPEEGRLDSSALDHYEAIAKGCVSRGIAPVVTFSHFTAPHWFAMKGGWLHEGADKAFAGFCDAVMERFGGLISIAVTLNEPNLPRLLSWVLPEFVQDLTRSTLEAASDAAGVPQYRSANVVAPEDYAALEAGLAAGHVAAKQAIKARRPELPVGLSIAMVDDIGVGEGHVIRDRKRAEVYDPWLRLAQDDDFIGVQNYEQLVYGPDGQLPAPEGTPVNDMGTAIAPDSLAGSVRYAYEIAQVPIVVTEHGITTADDTLRVGFLEPSFEALGAAMSEGIPVLGYFHWSLLDNFEWVGGYSSYLGLHSVDRATFERTPKPSAAEYTRLIRASSGRKQD